MIPTFKNVTGGGKDGQWVYVENLNPDGDLSLRHALTRTDIQGPRNIGFKVTGDIYGSIDVTNVSNFTIHGDTSPGGICLRNAPDDLGDTLNIQTDNVIIDNLRIRPGYTDQPVSEGRRALNFQRTKGAIVSNCSLTWAYDQICGAWYGCEDILFYRNIIAEGFHSYPNGKYGMGCLVGDTIGGTGGGDVYFYQNIFAHNKGRNPKTNIAGIAHLWNNLIYNPGDWVIHLDNRFGPPRADVIGNVLIPGAQSNSNAQWLVRADGGAELFTLDNIGWSAGVVYNPDSVKFRTDPFMPDIPFNTVLADKLEDHLYAWAGPDIRDDVDARILRGIRNRTGTQIGNEADVGGYPVLVAPEPEPGSHRIRAMISIRPPVIEGYRIVSLDNVIKGADGYVAIFEMEAE